MTKEEAIHILGVNNIGDVEDAFDDLVFDFKTFFTTKVPFTKLFDAKLKKLKRIFDAKELLLPNSIVDNILVVVPVEKNEAKNNVFDAYRSFGENEMKIRLIIAQSKSFKEFSTYVAALIANYKMYADKWKEGVGEEEEVNSIIMSVEPDVMKIYEEIKRFNSMGYSTFREINELSNDNLLKQEAIRLSLWSKFEENV